MQYKSSLQSIILYLVSIITACVIMQSCQKNFCCQKPSNATAEKMIGNPAKLDFDVKNESGRVIYVTCFAYMRRRDFGHWQWYKSPIYALKDGQKVTIDIPSVSDEQDRDSVFGYLGVFNDQQTADDAIYELTDDRLLLDLDQLIKLRGKMVTLTIEQYGITKEFFEYDFVKESEGKEKAVPSLDFLVENKANKPILATCFVYEKEAKGNWIAALEEKDDMSVWRFAKTPVIKLMPDQVGTIKVDPILGNRDRAYVRGYLAIFDEDEEQQAQEATFELLETVHKLGLGLLSTLRNKKIVIDVEKYGIMQDFIDFTIKPANTIDFTKLKRR